MSIEQLPKSPQQKKRERNYAQDFKPEWLEDPELLERARKFAEFYRKQLATIQLEATADEEILIHFTNDRNFNAITSNPPPVLQNRSTFYDGGRKKAETCGVNLNELDEKFGNNFCVTTIPVREFNKWTRSLSWLKLADAGVLNNAFVFKLPKKNIILRDGRLVDEEFRLLSVGKKDDKKRPLTLAYFSSTSHHDENLFSANSMLEAWIPHEVSLEDAIRISYQEE
ncbi:MAG: hypothetical protein NTV81_01930 [Candidatus Komeilibacteria bacterium]|nr:hypothetical protein [Candidatus Komeilibacteria bacterium]